MFGVNRFSLTGFSLSEDVGGEIQVDVSFSADLKSVSGASVFLLLSLTTVEAIWGFGRGTIAAPSSFRSEVALVSESAMRANVVLSPYVAEVLKTTSEGCKDKKIIGEIVSAVQSKSWAGKTIPNELRVVSKVLPLVFGSKNILRGVFSAETATTLSDAGKLSIARTTVVVTIPPGEELRIDSDTYRVLLGRENVLYAQEGDWIHLSRETLYLDIESATGGKLEGQMTYQERYL